MDRDQWHQFTSTGQLEDYLRYKELEHKRERRVGRLNGNGDSLSDWDLLHRR